MELVHIIPQNRSCTENLLRHLIDRGLMQDIHERIIFVGESTKYANEIRRAGYLLELVSAESIERQYGIVAAPLLVVFAKMGALLYLGGYHTHAATIHPKDIELMRQINDGGQPEALPLYGCAISPELINAIDPPGVRY